jgi:hypothetical protein
MLTLGAYVSLESLRPNLLKTKTDDIQFYERQAVNYDLIRYIPWNFACSDHMDHLRSPVSADSLYSKNIYIFSASACSLTTYDLTYYWRKRRKENNLKRTIPAFCNNCTCCLYGPGCNDFDAGSIHYKGLWKGGGVAWKSRHFAQKNLEINSEMESAYDTPLVHKNMLWIT